MTRSAQRYRVSVNRERSIVQYFTAFLFYYRSISSPLSGNIFSGLENSSNEKSGERVTPPDRISCFDSGSPIRGYFSSLSLSLLPFPSLPFSLSFFSLLNPGPSDFFFSKKFLEGQKKKGRGCEEHPAALPSPSPLFRLFEFVERVRFRVYFRARVDVSQGRGGEGVGGDTLAHVNGRYYARGSPLVKSLPPREGRARDGGGELGGSRAISSTRVFVRSDSIYPYPPPPLDRNDGNKPMERKGRKRGL